MSPSEQQPLYFEGVTLLVTHYNRSRSLEQLLQSFAALNCRFESIVVSDDGSRPEHLEYLVALQQTLGFRLVTTPKNKGLGNNLNKGQDAVQTPLTLYVQEDFTPADTFPHAFGNALKIMQARPDVDMVRFYAYFEYPYLRDPENGFYRMDFKLWKPGYRKFYVYSDHPHLRRTSFFNKFGRYVEGQKGDFTEYQMMMSFLKNNGKAYFYKDFKSLFLQKNSEAEPSTMTREHWRQTDSFPVKQIRDVYRHVKFNLDYLR